MSTRAGVRPFARHEKPASSQSITKEDTVITRQGTTAVLPTLLDIPALAEHLGVTPRHVRRMVAERRIPYGKWGHLIRFNPVEVAAWLEKARVPDGPRP